jgi:hypothetical protein
MKKYDVVGSSRRHGKGKDEKNHGSYELATNYSADNDAKWEARLKRLITAKNSTWQLTLIMVFKTKHLKL